MSDAAPLISILSRKVQLYQGQIDDFSHYFESNIAKSEAFLVPHDALQWSTEYRQYVSRSARQKPVIFFNTGDRPRIEKIANSYSLQSAYTSTPLSKVIIIPYNVENLSFLPFRSKSPNPSLSFVGYVPKTTLGRIARSLREKPLKPWEVNSSVIRSVAVHNMLRSFPSAKVLQRKHYGGARSLIEDPIIFRKEYVSSISESDFVLCPRGDANSSQRYYEVLSAGRIPLVPETGMKFPRILHSSSDKLHLNIDMFARNIEVKVNEYWKSLDDEQYLDLQNRLRKFFKQNLMFNSFLHTLFKSELKNLDDAYCYKS